MDGTLLFQDNQSITANLVRVSISFIFVECNKSSFKKYELNNLAIAIKSFQKSFQKFA